MGGGFYCDSPAPRLRFASPGDSPAPASTERWQPTAKSKAPERSVVKVAGAVASVWRGRKNTGACAASVDPRRAPVVCSAAEPIICAVDVTGSMGEWPRVIYDKLPMFYGQIMLQDYLTDPAIMCAAPPRRVRVRDSTLARAKALCGAAGAARRFAGVADTKMREDGGGTQTPLMVTEFGQGLVLDEYMRSIGLGAGLCVACLRRLS